LPSETVKDLLSSSIHYDSLKAISY